MKKASLFLMVVCMLFALAACNSTDDQENQELERENWEYEIVRYRSYNNNGGKIDSDGKETDFAGTAQAGCADDMNKMAKKGWEVVDVELANTDSMYDYVYIVTYRRPK